MRGEGESETGKVRLPHRVTARACRMALLAAVLLPCLGAHAAPIAVTIQPRHQQVRVGEAPRFTVRVTSVLEPLWVFRFAARRDLRDHFAKVYITRNGRKLDLPAQPAQLGSLGADAYELLNPDETMTFAHDGSPLSLSTLPQGRYVVNFGVQPNTREPFKYSNAVTFEVVGR